MVLRQPHRYTGCAPAAIDYVKFVPLSQGDLDALEAPYAGEHDKFIAGYWEPYSYAFHDVVTEPLWHRQYLSAYPEARVDLADMQIGRFGMKVVYESRLTDNLYYATRGDPIGTVQRPETDNVGRMQQFTNTLEASLRYAGELGIRLHANFGASNCYPGSPLQGDFSKAHPEWMRGSALRYEVPEVRAYALSLYREALEIGARGLSLDFCRYPETIDTAETCNTFLRELRVLADEFGQNLGIHIPVLVRFPAYEVRKSDCFDYATWAREGWVDYLCPSNIQGRHIHFEIEPYLDAVKGTEAMVLPCIDGLGWGVPMPAPFFGGLPSCMPRVRRGFTSIRRTRGCSAPPWIGAVCVCLAAVEGCGVGGGRCAPPPLPEQRNLYHAAAASRRLHGLAPVTAVVRGYPHGTSGAIPGR